MALPTPGVTPANWGEQLNDEILAASKPIATTVYAPGSSAVYATTSATMVDADATNLAVTFTVPVTGAVWVHLDAWVSVSGGTTTYNWGLRQSTTVVGDTAVIYSSAGGQWRMGAWFRVTGLTPDASLTYKWGHYLSFGTNSSSFTAITLQPAIMRVFAAA